MNFYTFADPNSAYYMQIIHYLPAWVGIVLIVVLCFGIGLICSLLGHLFWWLFVTPRQQLRDIFYEVTESGLLSVEWAERTEDKLDRIIATLPPEENPGRIRGLPDGIKATKE